jgi:2-methylcitrate dehydratase PrpD
VSVRCDHPRGAPENALSRAQVEEKFRTYASTRFADAHVEEIVGMVSGLEELGSARKLMDSLRVDESRRLRASAAA